MRAFDFTPYYRSTVGFDGSLTCSTRALVRLAALQHREGRRRPLSDHHDRRRLCPYEIELVHHGATLPVTGQKSEQPELLHQGIPLSFKQSFNLADHVKVAGANVEQGLLMIDLVREVPEQLKLRRIDLGARAETKAAKSESQPKQIDTGTPKAA
jgi:molecular chaperone IbpA